MLVGSDRPTDRQTMSLIELSWTAKNVATLEIHPYPSSYLLPPNRADVSLHICLHSTSLLAPLLHSSSQTKNIALSCYALPSFTETAVHIIKKTASSEVLQPLRESRSLSSSPPLLKALNFFLLRNVSTKDAIIFCDTLFVST